MSKNLYRVIFVQQDQLFEVYAKEVYQSDLYGFVEVRDYVFGNCNQMVVDPAEEKLKNTFSQVKRSFVPMHAVVRIDEVERSGISKISDAKGSVSPFPLPGRGPGSQG